MSSLTISTIQTNLFWEDKAANLSMLENKIRSISEKTEIIVLPEMFTTGFTMNAKPLAETMEGDTLQWMKKISQEQGAIMTGSTIIEEAGQYFNRMIWMLPNGQWGHYDKKHLFAYAGEDKTYTAGKKRLIASVKGWKINLQICYDLRFPVWARQQMPADHAQPEYDILMYVANWPAKRSHAWKTLLCARAIENQCYVIGLNRVGRDGNQHEYSGDSLVIDPLGEVLYHMAHTEDVFTVTLEKEKLEEARKKFPFLGDADSFSLHPL